MGGILLIGLAYNLDIGVINLVKAKGITNSSKKIWFLNLDRLAYAYIIEKF